MSSREPIFAPSAIRAFHKDDPAVAEKSLEARHVGVVRAFYTAIERQDWHLLGESLADDVEVELFGMPELPQRGARGRESVLDLLRQNFSAVESSRSEIDTLAAQGSIVLAIARDRGTIKPTGGTYEVDFLVHFDFRDGRIIRARQWVLPTT